MSWLIDYCKLVFHNWVVPGFNFVFHLPHHHVHIEWWFYLGLVQGATSYYYSRYLSNFYDAASDCEKIGGYLVKLDNINEMNALNSMK